jgi:PAS domain S-box-containing protein
LLATNFQAITHPEDLAADIAHIDLLLAGTSGSFQMEKRYIRKDGRIVWVLLSTAIIRDEQGAPLYFIGQVEDITARKEVEAELTATHQHTREVLDRITDNFYALDNSWRITYINDAVERNFGYSRDELLGQNMWERFPQGRDLPFFAALHQAQADGRARTVEALYPRTDRWYEARIYPSPNGLSVFFRDVTEQKQKQQAVQEALEAAQAGVRAKTRFLAMMSHELRTPLQTIAGNAELLLAGRDGPLTPLQAEDVSAIHSGATRMTTLIAELLELARPVENGGDRVVDPVELLQVVDQVRQDMAAHAETRQLALRVDLPPRLPAVRGDAVRLRQTLLNLVANAIKFTETGAVCIDAKVA